ncbi:MAG: GGDEF domain-containing protein [Lachnospiraceae bacterium]|nr:GGDEF domain-containing protein [Lachnospiraceae bacterium]
MLQRVLLQALREEVSLFNTILIVVSIAVCFIAEEFSYRKNYFDSVLYVKILRYTQCIASVLMIGFMQMYDGSEVAIISFVLLFMIDFFLAMEVSDKEKVLSCVAMVGVPLIVVIVIKMSISLGYEWLFLFFDAIILLVVLFFEAYYFVDYNDKKDKLIYSQQRAFDELVEKNENILNMQDKIKNTNFQLNIQKHDLQNANHQIQLANKEMVAQAEILHYISMSFDMSKISNQITESIMMVRQLGFCGVYIKEGAYLNKHPNYVIKTTMGQLHRKIKDSIEDLYTEVVERGETEVFLHDDETSRIPFLRNVNINSVYMKLLGTEEENYGLFIIGDSRRNLFRDNMSFYDVIMAQYDIAIQNTKTYNEMQQMARKDGLTGINNRIYFNQLFQENVQQVIREDGCMSVALFDIDKFKSVNDTYGHLAGDEVIKCIATVAEQCIEKYNGFVCRYGGEEFVAALPNTKLEVAQPIIEELFDEICSKVVLYNEYTIPISISIGLTSYPEICKNPDELLKRADWCMYYAKEHGRHQINVDDGSIERV